eukprot:SAG31_NODE_430_length_15792_cov_15.908558_21_plen_56_part_00
MAPKVASNTDLSKLATRHVRPIVYERHRDHQRICNEVPETDVPMNAAMSRRITGE